MESPSVNELHTGCDAIRSGNIPGIPENPSLDRSDSAVMRRILSAKTKKGGLFPVRLLNQE